MKLRFSRRQPAEPLPAVRPADLRLAVPWYLHPAENPEQWAELMRQAQAGRIAFAVVNVANGPGLADDPYYPGGLDALRQGGVPLHGYVDTDYGARPSAQVLEDISVWKERYDVEGVMFDRVSADPANLGYYKPIAAFARQIGVEVLVGNPGVIPHQDYLETFDVCCVFENVDTVHRRLTTMRRPGDIPPERLWHLVYDVPPGGFESVLERTASQGAALVFATDRGGANPWCGLSAELLHEMDRLGIGARHSTRA
ncbi:spherulation-specific family 4 protein [Kribbella amoyensis]|uniref:Spherulation-specific family 4 protein n=1 Tax=Kribbella amoyensis TaxID=996641 RepID=A0A561BMS6_9ACTN|nr:spherulation-specific family 4 protein [Kribbella amoyensis]TWD80175.1 spherulation-specific family 4 protein [Kribbella amoyensis]